MQVYVETSALLCNRATICVSTSTHTLGMLVWIVIAKSALDIFNDYMYMVYSVSYQGSLN